MTHTIVQVRRLLQSCGAGSRLSRKVLGRIYVLKSKISA
jgi:hypothetical protein